MHPAPEISTMDAAIMAEAFRVSPQSQSTDPKRPSAIWLILALAATLGVLWASLAFGQPTKPVADPVDPVPQILIWGAPESSYVTHGDYLLAYNGQTRCARWTLEYLTTNQVDGPLTRGELDFHEDRNIPAEFRATNADYKGHREFARGHLAAAANHSDTQENMRSTFTLANACPQYQSFNSGIWLALENHVRGLTANGAEVWCVTCPLWMPEEKSGIAKIKTLGESRIWIPTHCGKAVIVRTPDGHLELLAWIIPNSDVLVGAREGIDKWAVSTDAFESASGINVWPDGGQKIESMEKGLK